MSILTSRDISHIDRNNYPNLRIAGSDRIYYNRYPYKVALIDNQISYDVSRALEIYDWLDLYQEDVKFKSSMTRHVYFKYINLLDFFISMFEDQILNVQGPVSTSHVNYLLERKHNSEIHNPNFKQEIIIRKTKCYNEYDCKVWIGVSYNYSDSAVANWRQSNQERITVKKNVIKTIQGIVNKNRHHRWSYIYCDSKYMEDIQFYVKLKHPSARIIISKALVEENL